MARSPEREAQRGRFFAALQITGGFLRRIFDAFGIRRAFRAFLELERDRSK